MPGGSESSSDDGSFSVTRYYNGAISGGSGGSGEASWSAFRAANPPGTADPIYGSDALSTAYPSVTEARAGTYVASITFSGGTFEPGKDTSKPQISLAMVAKELEVKHSEDVTKKVGLNYQAVQTTIRYTKSSTPDKSGEKGDLADKTVALKTSPPILQNLPDELDELTDVETLVEDDFWLSGFEASQRSDEGGNTIWDVTEIWVQGLKKT